MVVERSQWARGRASECRPVGDWQVAQRVLFHEVVEETQGIIKPFKKPVIKPVFKSKPFKKVECGIRHRYIWPLMDDLTTDCSSISEYMEMNMGPVMKASPFSQFGMSRSKSLSQRLSLVSALQAGCVGICVDAQSWEAQHSTQSVSSCVSDTRAAMNHNSDVDDFAELSTTWVLAQPNKQVISERGDLVGELDGTLFSAEGPTATVNTMELESEVGVRSAPG